jgi:multidrug transporter EmrE-like cation transporter
MNYLYIAGTIVFSVYGQLILKWRVTCYGALPASFTDKIIFLLKVSIDPFILSGFTAAFLAALCWMAAMTKFELSFAYPFTSLGFVLVLILSGLIFKEPVSLNKIAGMILIVAGIIVGAQG